MTRAHRNRILAYRVPGLSRDDVRDKFTRAGPPPLARAARASVAQQHPSTAGTPPARVLIDMPESAGSPVPPLLPAPAVVDTSRSAA